MMDFVYGFTPTNEGSNVSTWWSSASMSKFEEIQMNVETRRLKNLKKEEDCSKIQ